MWVLGLKGLTILTQVGVVLRVRVGGERLVIHIKWKLSEGTLL